VPEPSVFEVETATGKLVTDQIAAELIKAGRETISFEIHKIICSVWNKEELPQQWKESIIGPIHKSMVIRQTVRIIVESPSYQLPKKFYPTFFCSC
jgi:hypothetical protein